MLPPDSSLPFRAALRRLAAAVLAAGVLPFSLPSHAADSPAASPDFRAQIKPLLETYCYACHGYGGDEGGMAIDTLADAGDRVAHRDQWLAVWRNLRAQMMPPSQEDQPTPEERALIIRWIERDVFKIDPDNPDPGRVTVRRLNRVEYRNTIRDLLGVDFKVEEEFPADDTGYGFDTIGDVLSMSPLLVEKYLEAARTIVAEAVPTDPKHNNYRRIFVDGPPPEDNRRRAAYARKILGNFASRAFRRQVDKPTLDKLVALALETSRQPDRGFEEGIAHAMTAVLASPRFLFRAEIQPEPNNPGKVVKVDEFALASRLSYFLWSSMPDDELFELAKKGQLRRNLRAQVDRMLDDKRAERLVDNFVGQWLQTRDVETTNIDPRRILRLRDSDEAYRIFGRRVRQAMRQETEMLFAHLLKENGSALDLLTADYTFLNEDLAEFYGIEGVEGREMRKVDLPEDSHRRGILTHGSFLVVTSNPTRTSPVKRGLFVLENLLGTPAPPPPPDVPELPVDRRRRGQEERLTMRQMMEAHREQPMCASCHARMDPLGLALENFNAIGMWREEDGGEPINPAGQLLTGEKFEDVHALAEVLATDRRHDFYRCLAEKMFTYAVGRGVEYYDSPTIDRIVDQLEEDGGRIRTLIFGIIESTPFQSRRGDGERRA